MRTVKWLILFGGIFYVAFFLIQDIRLAKVTVNVVDEEGKPVDGAAIGVVFKYGHLTKDQIHGITDHNGKYSIWSRTPDGTLVGDVIKKGYYDSGFGKSFFKKKYGIWLPWNEQLTVLLRPIVNPVPMYVRNVDWVDVPVIDKEIGFDLMESDWVKPYGKGIHSDFIIRMEHLHEGLDEYATTMTLTFPNKLDGIQLVQQKDTFYSQFKLPRTAPESGYQNKLVKRFVTSIKKKQFINDHNDSNNYIFRVRTNIDNGGNVKQSMYGKILGDMNFAPPTRKEKAAIKMYYYLNPDYTRNLEFDPKRNLFKNLPKDEKVSLP